MSAKWRALQRRHKWTYDSVELPPSYLETIKSLPTTVSELKFFNELTKLVSLGSIHAQVASFKHLVSAFSELFNKSHCDQQTLRLALQLYLEILFQENSLPLHRNILSAFSHQFPSAHHELVTECFGSLCNEYGDKGRKYRRFAMSCVPTSIVCLPKVGFLKGVVGYSADVVAHSLCVGLRSVMKEVEEGGRPSPTLMEQCQEAMSSLYYLVQQFPYKFPLQGGHDTNIQVVVMRTILDVLKLSAFSRDCLVTAGVCFSAALQIGYLDSELVLLLSNVIFSQAEVGWVSVDGVDVITCESEKIGPGGLKVCELAAEFQSIPEFCKLCVLRGMLTVIPRMVLNYNLVRLKNGGVDMLQRGCVEKVEVWTLLFDGVLPAICTVCENPIDSHFNFHSVTALQICLQQIKASLFADISLTAQTDLGRLLDACSVAVRAYKPFPQNMLSRILRIIWSNWEDPLNQTVKQVNVVFELVIDVYSYLLKDSKFLGKGEGDDVGEEETESPSNFLRRIANELLLVGSHRKGRYMPLATIGKWIGARNLLEMRQNLLFETVGAYADDDICCAATSFLRSFLENLREECCTHAGSVKKGYAAFRRLWVPAVLLGLVSESSKLRSNLNTYALPIALQIDSDSIFTMFSFLFSSSAADIKGTDGTFSFTDIDNADGLPGSLTLDQIVTASVSLLKVARSLALIEGDVNWSHNHSVQSDCSLEDPKQNSELFVVNLKGLELQLPLEWLKHALTHSDESIRIDVAEFIFLNPKTSTLVSTLELYLMRISIPLNMRCSSTAFRMKWTSMFKKFFLRVRTTMERHMKQALSRLSAKNCSTEHAYGEEINKQTDLDRITVWNFLDSGARELDQFMKWLSRILIFSLYPSAPYERKTMAMELFLIMIDIWPVKQGNIRQFSEQSSSESSLYYFPYEKELLADFTAVIVGAIVDSWDKLRENSFQILLKFPNPLPCIDNKVAVENIVMWAKALVGSPRVRESDAGALTLRLVFRKYVQELGWSIMVAQNKVSEASILEDVLQEDCLHKSDFGHPTGDYIESLTDWLQFRIEEAEKDLVKACENSFVHGILLTLRYTIEELDWSVVSTKKGCAKLKAALQRILSLAVRITSLALWVVSADALSLPENLENFIEDCLPCPETDEKIDSNSVNGSELKESENGNVGPTDQVVMVGCWLAMKELSLLLGTITRKVPLPSCNVGLSSNQEGVGDFVGNRIKKEAIKCILDADQLELIGEHFLQVLLSMKHNGAIDKTRAGFTALCNRLLCSTDPRLNKMPEAWMKQLMQRTVAKGQTVDDLLRRSAGIPASFIALFLAEPEGTPKKLLLHAMRWLIDIAKSFLSNSVITNGNVIPNNALHIKNGNAKQNDEPFLSKIPSQLISAEDIDNNLKSKQRDEGVVPTVHVFNVLRVAINDTNLSTDTSGFCAEALVTAIQAFSSHYWEVRNSGTLAYTALVHRMIGFLNVHKRESARRSLTGFEFFHRYPILHPFLLEELKNATEQLEESSSLHYGDAKLGESLHPSLVPVLIILSRFKPSTVRRGTDDWLSPSLFLPFVQRCATQRNLNVRVLASRALAPLLPREDLLKTLIDLVDGLPTMDINLAKKISLNPKKSSFSFNAVHGKLLQVDSLLTTNCIIVVDAVEKDKIIRKLFPLVEGCSWLGNANLCSCPIVSGAYLNVLGNILYLAQTSSSSTHVSTIKNLLVLLSSQCLDTSAQHGRIFFDSSAIDLQVQAATVYLSAFLPSKSSGLDFETLDTKHSSEECMGFLEKFKACLSHHAYEVRFISLKVLKQTLQVLKRENTRIKLGTFISSVCEWLKSNMVAVLPQFLEREKNPKCLCKLLEVIFLSHTVPMLQSSACSLDSFTEVLSVWNSLVSLKNTVRHGKTKEVIIGCLGIYIKKLKNFIKCHLDSVFSNHASSTEYDLSFLKSDQLHLAFECLATWIELIKSHSDPSEIVNMRKATAEGIMTSTILDDVMWISPKLPCLMGTVEIDILKQMNTEYKFLDMYGRAVLDTWFTSIKLLEDEDANLRQNHSVALVSTMNLASCKSTIKVMPSQIERVLELCFEFLTSSFRNWIVYLDYLTNSAFGSESDYMFMPGNADLVRRLFDKELDNHHEERLLISQLCCMHMESNLAVQDHCAPNDKIESFVKRWRMKFLSKAICFAELYNQMGSSFSWVGGIANHQDVFRIMYPCLLGLYAFSFHSLDEKQNDSWEELSSKLIELDKLMTPLLSNPLVLDLYLISLNAYEKLTSTDLGFKNLEAIKGGRVYKNFDPYFLIR